MLRETSLLRFCTVCNKEIIWAINQEGKRIPVDPEPSPTGAIGLRFEENRTFVTIPNHQTFFDSIDDSEPLYNFHYQTCEVRADG